MQLLSSCPPEAPDTVVVEKQDKTGDISTFFKNLRAGLTIDTLVWRKRSGPSGRLCISRYLPNLKTVILSSSTTTIGEWAFAHCEKLESVVVSGCLASIGKGAFQDSGLKTITLPETLEEIQANCFLGCHSLKMIDISPAAAIETIPDNFARDSAITTFRCPNRVKFICRDAFRDTNLEEIVLNEGLSGIEWGAFKETKLKSLHLPATLKHIEFPLDTIPRRCHISVNPENQHYLDGFFSGALVDRYGIMLHYPQDMVEDETLNVPHGVQSVRRPLLEALGITEIYLPETFRLTDFDLPHDIFPYTMKSVKVNIHNPDLADEDGVLYTREMRRLLYFPPCHTTRDFTVPASVSSVASKAFSSRTDSVVFMSDVILENDAFYGAEIHSCVFHGNVTAHLPFSKTHVFALELHKQTKSFSASDSRIDIIFFDAGYVTPVIKGLENTPTLIAA